MKAMNYRIAHALSESTKMLSRYAIGLPDGSEERERINAQVDENIAIVKEWDESRERILKALR